LRLSRIAKERDDPIEIVNAGRLWSELDADALPPCHAERAGFMAPTPRRIRKDHPYAEWNEVYRKFQPAWIELPAYSADCVPFRWMLREQAVSLSDALDIGYEGRLEEQVDAEASLNSPAWIQHEQNQRAMLDTFFSAVRPGSSLVFFYAKETPLSDDPRRTLIGVGRVTGMTRSLPYGNPRGGFGSATWETPIQHSIRPTMDDGFLLPYSRLLELGREGGLDPREFVVHVPDEFFSQFSYATEHVTHDAALSLLLALAEAVNRFATLVPGDWERVRTWLSERLAEVWSARGAFPGLGTALTAFGVPQGVLLSYGIQGLTPENGDPWDVVNRFFTDPGAFSQLYPKPDDMLRKVWASLPEQRRDLLTLISRFDLTIEQATRMYVETERTGIKISDAEFLANPYRFFEADRFRLDPIAVATVDRGVFPVDKIRADFPVTAPSRVDSALDERRVRALVVDRLERAATDGHSLMARDRLIQAVRDEPLDPACPLTVDFFAVAAKIFEPEITSASMADGSPAYQLSRLSQARDKISRTVLKRLKARPLPVSADWPALIDGAIADTSGGEPINQSPQDPLERSARQEKAKALETLAQSRVSVLVGPAGTGKTTLLRALCRLPEVGQRGVLLLAPTGKARVRMQTAIGKPAMTLAQLLVLSDRYDPETGRYKRSAQTPHSGVSTVIVDECSMLTEEQLDALLDSIEGYERLILVGDPRQLPPIGVGRPFVDIVERIRTERGVTGFPLVAPSYAELTVRRRQLDDGSTDAERSDLVLADWFSGGNPPPGSDEIWNQLADKSDLGTLAVRNWSTLLDLHRLLRSELAHSLTGMSDSEDIQGFQASYGGQPYGGHVYFNISSAERAESWQVLSPIRGDAGGVNELNRMLQRAYRGAALALAGEDVPWKRRIPRPAGPQEIVYGDKVINVRNKTRKKFWPKADGALAYVANGEIGVVSGPFRKNGATVSLDQWDVAFSTQPGIAYKFGKGDFGDDDGSPALELAYAITVHKAQGSEFGTTFVVVPSPCRLLTRELLYTALTRHQQRVVLLVQGDPNELRNYASPNYSETATRITNLFDDPNPIEVDGRFLEQRLIHRTRKGINVRSKSEVIIADLLYSKGVEFTYERELVLDGSKRLPDFTIEDADTGETFYWEHLGMLNNDRYRRKWEEKLIWYASHGIRPRGTGPSEDPDGTLIVTKDGVNGSISSADIEVLVDDIFGA